MNLNTTSDLHADRAQWFGIAFSLAFTALIWLLGSRLDQIQLLPDTGPAWYYWRLPQPTYLTRLSAWGLYALHQVSIWALIYYAQTRVGRYGKKLQGFHYGALGVNALFIGLHLVQTHLFYDGLAQDVAVWTSQGSVILLLVIVLLMENSRRGLFWGKQVPFGRGIIDVAKRYHGYLFSWAIIYTFWFHPMVATSGHLIGFFYMFLLMLQGSLFFTPVHLNRIWTTILEVLVLVHGTLVALMNTNGLWPMFFFGFLGIFVITQMHRISLSSRARWLILAGYIGAAVLIYSGRGIDNIHQITWIPVIEYLAVFVVAGLIWLGVKLFGKPLQPAGSPASGS